MEADLSKSFHRVNASFAHFTKKEKTSAPEESHVFQYTGSSSSCLLCFIYLSAEATTVATTASGRREQTSTAKMLWSHPLPPALVLTEYPNIAKFALASSGTSFSTEQLTFTFVLTNAQGVRKYGHCTSFVNGETAVCISPYPWCNFFYRLAYLYRTNPQEGARDVVRALCRCGTPPSGADFLTPLDLGVKFTRPYDRLCSFIDTSPLDMLTVFADNDTLFSVLTALLLEKHVVIVGPNFPIVSNVMMSLQALIAPFEWVHILIPILPSDLLDVLGAPPPYLVGILTTQLALIARVPLDSAVMVHLGVDGICERVEHWGEVKDHMPHSGPLSALRVGLSLLRLRNRRDQTVRDLCSLFMTYYASVFGEVVLKGAKGYIKSHRLSRRTVVFYEKLLATQSFNLLSEEVHKVISADNVYWMDNEFIVAVIRAHADVYPNHYAQLIDEEKSGGGYVVKHEDCFGSKEEFNSLTAAIHGFGGHKLGVSRLLVNCLCGCLCPSWFTNGEDDTAYNDETSYRFFRGSLADTSPHRMRAGRVKSAKEGKAEEEMMTTPVIEAAADEEDRVSVTVRSPEIVLELSQASDESVLHHSRE